MMTPHTDRKSIGVGVTFSIGFDRGGTKRTRRGREGESNYRRVAAFVARRSADAGKRTEEQHVSCSKLLYSKENQTAMPSNTEVPLGLDVAVVKWNPEVAKSAAYSSVVRS